ncbi:MAG: SPOR domain-containing protein [Pseudomonadota bacterium]
MRARAGLLAATLLAAGALITPASADVQSGVVKYEGGDFSGAIQEWLPLASENDPNALFNLGQVYRLGRGVGKDMDAARNYYERAARLGHVSAQGNLGTLYFFAEDRAIKDEEKAVSWWQEAATNGDARSQYMLGVLHFNGDVVDRNWTRAYAWMSLAASSGLPEASQAETSMLKHMTAAQVADAREISLTLVNPAGAFPNSMPVQFAKSNAPVNPATATKAAVTDVKPAAPAAVVPVSAAPAVQEAAPEAPVADTLADAAAADVPLDDTVQEPVQLADAVAAVPEPSYEADVPAPPVYEEVAEVPAVEPIIFAYKLQLAAFSSQENANSGWSVFADKHGDVLASLAPDVEAADLGERGTLYRLYANGFATKAEARAACDSLKSAGQGCLVVSSN